MFLGELPIFDCLRHVYMLTRDEMKMDPAHPCPMGQAIYQRVCSDSEQRLSHQMDMVSTFGFTFL